MNKEEKIPLFNVGDTIIYKYNNIYSKQRIIAKVCGVSHYLDTDDLKLDMAYTDANFKLVEVSKSNECENALNSAAVTFLEEQQITADMVIRAFKQGAKWQNVT